MHRYAVIQKSREKKSIMNVCQSFRRMLSTLACGLLLVGLTACTGMTANDSYLTRDILEIKQKLDKQLEQQTSSDRKIDYALESLRENQQGRNEMLTTRLDDLEKRLREQSSEMNAIRGELEELTFMIDTLAKRMGMSAGFGGSETGAANGGMASPGNAGQGGSAAEQAMNSALQQYNLGNFEQAREGFRRALEQNPAPETKALIRFWLAETTYKLNDLQTAVDLYKQVILEHPDHPKAWVSLERYGDITYEQGELEHALAMLQTIVDQYPQYPEIERVQSTIERIKQEMGAPAQGQGSAASPAPQQQPAPQPAIADNPNQP